MYDIDILIRRFGSIALLTGLVVGCGDASFFDADESSTEAPVLEAEENDGSSSTSTDSEESDGSKGTSKSDDSNDPGVRTEDGRALVPTAPNDRVELPDKWKSARPLKSWVTNNRRLAVKNLLPKALPYTAYVHVHGGGVLYVPLFSIPPGETTLQPAPKEAPGRAAERMKNALVRRAGFSRQRAEQLVQKRKEELFEKHGSRVAFVAPDSWVQKTGRLPLGGVAAPNPPWK